MNWTRLCKLGGELPDVVEGTWYGTPALKVRGKGFVRLKEDGLSVVFLLDDVDDQEILIERWPDIYHITDHYIGYPAVLARLTRLGVPECRLRLERAWLQRAPRTLIRQFEANRRT